jgi:glycosyltransferase involved in cell wall biosynthesis
MSNSRTIRPYDSGAKTLLHLIGSVDPTMGGPVEALGQLFRVFERNGIRIEVASLDQPDAPFLKDCPFKVHALGRHKGTEQWPTTKVPWVRYRYSRRYPKWLAANLADYRLVILHGLWTHASLGALGPLSRSNRPYFVFTHGALDPWFRRTYPVKHRIKQLFWWAGEGRLLSNARRVLFTSESERRLARGAFLGYRVNETVIRYGIADPPPSADRQQRAFGLAAPRLGDRRYLLFLSRIHPKKGCDLLVRAFAEVAREDPELQLVIAGPDETGWRKALMQTAREAQVDDRIHWPGMLKGDAKWGAFRGCEAFVLPSHQENFGIVVAEALACGKPALISDQVNIWREVDEAGAGVVRPDTLDGTVDLLRAWIGESPAEKQARGIAARRCFLNCFDIRRTSADILGLVREVLDNDAP